MPNPKWWTTPVAVVLALALLLGPAVLAVALDMSWILWFSLFFLILLLAG